MKVRIDFVTNSSSSSYTIVKINKSDMLETFAGEGIPVKVIAAKLAEALAEDLEFIEIEGWEI